MICCLTIAVGIYCIVNVKQGDARSSSDKPVDWRSKHRFTRRIKPNRCLGNLNELVSSLDDTSSELRTAILDKITSHCTTSQKYICKQCTYTTTMTSKPCTPCGVSTTKDKHIITTLTDDTVHPQDRSSDDECDCTGIGFLGAVAGVIITSTLCICWIWCKRPKSSSKSRDFERQAMTNKTYGITGGEKVDDVGSNPRQRSVVYNEINDDPTHGHQKFSQVAPIIRDTEEKPKRAIHDRDVYNHLNEQVNKDEADDYDHARPVPVQNNDTDNAYGKLDKMAAIPKSIPDDKRISSPSVNHDYGELVIVETEGVKRPGNGTQNLRTDDNVGNDDNDNYFILDKSQI